MIDLRLFFTDNRPLIYFIYGQVFFVLGLAIVLQSWRHSRLTMARNLQWLAAFGLTHALYEWGDIFIPIHAQYVSAPLLAFLRSLHAIMLAVSFACLFQFGVEALRPLPGGRRLLRLGPLVLLFLWIGWTFGPALAAARDLRAWDMEMMILARYTLGLPGARLFGCRLPADGEPCRIGGVYPPPPDAANGPGVRRTPGRGTPPAGGRPGDASRPSPAARSSWS